MILDHNGRPYQEPSNSTRRGMQVDGCALPDGVIVSMKKSLELHNKIKTDSRLRERIEAADRMTGTESIHLALLRRTDKTTGMDNQIEKDLVKNQEFGETVQRKRVVDEKLKTSHVAYEV